MANKNSICIKIDKRVRASMSYYNWVQRHSNLECLSCHSTERLECHHYIPLYQIISSYWNIYHDEEQVFQHILMMHENDMVEGAMYCTTCHRELHYGRAFPVLDPQVMVANWCVIPRKLNVVPNLSVKPRPETIGLITYQTILGLGWYIMNGLVEDRVLKINRRRFAETIGKTPGASFNKSFANALRELEGLSIVIAHHIEGNNVEIYIHPEYLSRINENPWFVPLVEVHTNSMCVLMVRLWLGMQSKCKRYAIGLDKLKVHLGITTKNKTVAVRTIQKAVDQIEWLSWEMGEFAEFKISSKLPTPIRTLRNILTETITEAM